MPAIDRAKRNRHYRCLEYDHDQTGDVCLIACGMEQCDPGVSYGPEVRDCYHLHAILSGRGTLNAGGRSFYPHFGQLFLLKHNERVSYRADEKDPWQYCWVSYSGSEAKSISEKIGFTEGVYCLDSQVETREFYDLVCRMHEKPQMNTVQDLRRRGILLEFLALAMEAAAGERADHPRAASQYVQRAVEFIHYNYATIDVMDVVTYIGYTRSYFSSLFKKQTGLSPQEYIKQVRLRESARLLRDSGLSVQEIAAQVGYSDPLNFSRAFKNAYRLSPTDFRKQNECF